MKHLYAGVLGTILYFGALGAGNVYADLYDIEDNISQEAKDKLDRWEPNTHEGDMLRIFGNVRAGRGVKEEPTQFVCVGRDGKNRSVTSTTSAREIEAYLGANSYEYKLFRILAAKGCDLRFKNGSEKLINTHFISAAADLKVYLNLLLRSRGFVKRVVDSDSAGSIMAAFIGVSRKVNVELLQQHEKRSSELDIVQQNVSKCIGDLSAVVRRARDGNLGIIETLLQFNGVAAQFVFSRSVLQKQIDGIERDAYTGKNSEVGHMKESLRYLEELHITLQDVLQLWANKSRGDSTNIQKLSEDLDKIKDELKKEKDKCMDDYSTLLNSSRERMNIEIYLGCAYAAVDELTGPTMVRELMDKLSKLFGKSVIDEYQRWLNENDLPQPGSGADDEFVDLGSATRALARVTSIGRARAEESRAAWSGI